MSALSLETPSTQRPLSATGAGGDTLTIVENSIFVVTAIMVTFNPDTPPDGFLLNYFAATYGETVELLATGAETIHPQTVTAAPISLAMTTGDQLSLSVTGTTTTAYATISGYWWAPPLQGAGGNS